jgi:ADP-ribose pyrophosphatase YjhB (NUDIX family)
MPDPDDFQQLQLQAEELFSATGYAMSALGLVRQRGRVLLALDAHSRHWRLPGGPVRRMEAPADALRRAVRSSLGICVSVGEFLGVAHNPCECTVQIVFEMTPVEGCHMEPDTEEVVRAVWFRSKGLPANLCVTTRSSIEACVGLQPLPFLVTHRGGDGGVWQC